ncbi:DeoR/GlpR family DNA-binding transcription regulator [Raineyella sp. LH-20]|uniref:DeoR/GlpR family DNA-binding transcription regulator n=1 Tax=Raineyella sp. LH-20 TaxID=3081204 RepID=UPI00295505FF|nr:DeoR/GlpR family DNA-binding transcription regulator [Raineyella sp. LH-20]WOP19254.1 DeoR/GlpR family DNA-binding transcription regulator [Raineyella sp. LH-20]
MAVNGRREDERDRRRAELTEIVFAEGSVKIEFLPERLGVSLMTIHRDIDALVAQGIVRKTRGMVTALSTGAYEASSEYRLRRMSAEKLAVAEAATQFLEPGQSIILDDSTTGVTFAEKLTDYIPLTVITNYQVVMDICRGQQDLELIALGGVYYSWCSAYMGDITVQTLGRLKVDTFFMSTSAIADDVCYHQRTETIAVKRAMYEAARQRILYVDHSKFTAHALHALLPLTAFDVVIVDEGTAEQDLDRLAKKNVNVIVAPLEP